MNRLPDNAANRSLVAAVRPAEWVNPPPSGRYNFVIIGAGTAGLVTAAAAAGLGGKVALVEKHFMGGDCLNTGCVPSKALISAARVAALGGSRDFVDAMARVRGARAAIAPVDGAPRFRDELGIDVYFGVGKFTSRAVIEVDGQALSFARAVIATGARAAVPPIPGLAEAGYLTNESVFDLNERPARLTVIGGGPIGCELAQSFARLGSNVTLVDAAAGLLGNDDPDAGLVVRAALKRDGVDIVTDAVVASVETDRTVVIRCGDDERRVASDQILVAVGRRANTEDLGLEVAGVTADRGGIVVDDRLRTANKRIFAAGDCCSRWRFTHAADAMARIVVKNALFFGRAKVSDLVIPWCTYTDPEVAHVGLTPAGAASEGVRIDTYERPLTEVDRAVTDGATDGFVRIHTARGQDRIVGATIVAPHAGELIAQIATAMTAKLGLSAIASVIHPYPTLSLAIKQVGDQYNRTRLTPLVQRLFRWLLARRR